MPSDSGNDCPIGPVVWAGYWAGDVAGERGGHAAAARGLQPARQGRLARLCDPELENVPSREWPETEPIRGAEAVWGFLVEVARPGTRSSSSGARSSMPGVTRSCEPASRAARQDERRRRHVELLARTHVPRGQGASLRVVRRSSRGPRSRGAVGVGDVAGERGGRSGEAVSSSSRPRAAIDLSPRTSSSRPRSPDRGVHARHAGDARWRQAIWRRGVGDRDPPLSGSTMRRTVVRSTNSGSRARTSGVERADGGAGSGRREAAKLSGWISYRAPLPSPRHAAGASGVGEMGAGGFEPPTSRV